MKFKSITSLLSILIACTFTSYAKINNGKVTQLRIMDQLPSNSVFRVFQDKEGYMWFGTQDGLCRYDGSQMKIFRSDLNNSNLLTSNQISCIAEDFNENIWIGTYEGLNILNKNTYKITQHPDTGIYRNTVYSILNASDSTMWVGYHNVIKRYNSDFTIRDIYTHNPDFPNSIPNTNINYIFEDCYQNIWIALWQGGIYKYNKVLNQFVKYPKIGAADNPFHMFQDNRNNYWVGTWNDGLYFFNPNSVSKELYKKIPMPSWKDANDNSVFSFIQDDHFEYIWSMSMSGLTTFEYNEAGDISPINTQELLKNTNNIFSEIIKDREGSLWIGAFSEGIYKIDFNKPTVDNFPINILNTKNNIAPSFTSLCVDRNSDIWISQNRVGLFIYSLKKETIKYFTEVEKLKNVKELHKSTHINYILSRNEIWIANDLNSKIIKIKKTESDQISLQEIFLSKVHDEPGQINLFFEDNQSNVWIATDRALFAQATNSDSIVLICTDIGSISSITQDINNNIWIGTYNNGIYKIVKPINESQNVISKTSFETIGNKTLSSHIQSITADLSGNIWIGTKEGCLIAYNTLNKSFTNRTVDCGLKGETILDIIADKYNQIWVTTYKKIIEFNPKNNASFAYSASDGVQINSHLKGSFFTTKDSKYIYIGGNRGYSRFSPSEHLLAPPQQTEVKITDIKIQNESIMEQNISGKYNKAKNTLTLSPLDQNIELYFSALDFNNPDKIRYAYKLEGIDKDWVYLKKDRQFAVYSQLKKGNYTFCVKSSDSHNLWNDQIAKLTIIREPALYETNAAFTLYFVAIVLAIYMLFYIIVSRIKFRNNLKLTKIEKRKAEELSQTKLQYFTNISHDLLTPLTIISCLIDDIETTLPRKISQFSIMRSNVVRLKKLLQQILDFRRIESGKMQLSITNSDIASFINDICYNHFLPIINKKNIDFDFHTPHKEINAYFDADKIDKILFNLLSNAFKFTPANGKISISLIPQTNNGQKHLTIKVHNTGSVIPAQDIDNIFTRFYTGETQNAGETNGIGLSICKDLVELHHGRIYVESKLNEGTTFIFNIPIDQNCYSTKEILSNSIVSISTRTDESADLLNSNDFLKPVENNTPSSINILLVEDNLELLQLMKRQLSRIYSMQSATNGFEALEIVKSSEIDIIISDVMMPEMDGIELCKSIKDDIETSHISVILLTAKNSINDRIECYNAGADAYISKPFEMNVLVARINNFIFRKQTRQKEFKSNVEINISSLENHTIDDHFLNNAVDIIEKNISESEFDINMFAEELNLSKSTLYRKIKTVTGLSPIEFIRNIKLKHASVILQNNTISISEVAYAIGFSDPKYFSACFKSEFNITPSEYQKQQNAK